MKASHRNISGFSGAHVRGASTSAFNQFNALLHKVEARLVEKRCKKTKTKNKTQIQMSDVWKITGTQGRQDTYSPLSC